MKKLDSRLIQPNSPAGSAAVHSPPLGLDGLIAVPIYNEAAALPLVLAGLKSAVTAENLLFINDGSTDGSETLLTAAGVPYVSHPINLGYEETLKTGMHYAMAHGFVFVAFFDADGQHRLADLLRLIRTHLEGGYDLVLGSRYRRRTSAPVTSRVIGTKLFSTLAGWLANTRISDATCGLKLISRPFLPLSASLPAEDLHAELIVALSRAGATIREIAITVHPRANGTSMYALAKRLFYPAKTLLCLLCGMFPDRSLIPDRLNSSPED